MYALLTYLVDIAICTLCIRLVLGVLLACNGLVRLLLGVAGMGLLIYTAQHFELPLAGPLLLTLFIPALVLMTLNVLPELRRLQRMAHFGHLLGVREGKVEILPELTSCLLEMAAQRIGGIIVCPGHDSLEGLVHGGEPVSADFNKSLLLSIFNPKCPRHDGAVVVESGRLVRVGCVLPLAPAEMAPQNWGTRHLAAVGLTQLCDARVLVVSEQRGVISLARAGRLKMFHPPIEKDVRAAVTEALGLSADSAERWRRFSVNAAGWVLALCLATAGSLISGSLAKQTQSDRILKEFATLVTLKLPPEGLSVEGISDLRDTRVQIRVAANARPLLGSTGDPFPIEIDCRNLAPGPHTVKFTAQMLPQLDKGYEVDEFIPRQITFNIVKSQIVELKIQPQFRGLPDTLRLDSYAVEPAAVKVEVRGEEATPSIRTQTIDCSQIVNAGTYQLTATPEIPTNLRPVKSSTLPTSVKVTVVVAETPPAPPAAAAPTVAPPKPVKPAGNRNGRR